MTDLLDMVDEENELPVRTGELTQKIWSHFGKGYIKLTQVRAATGWADLNTADMMVMGEWPSTGNKLHGFEVKVSRADWLNEVKNPHKNDSVKKYCDLWWLVIADENMVRPGELPEDWGMMVWNGRGRKLRVVKQAPLRQAEPMDNCFVASLLRHNDKDTIPIDIHNDKLRDVARDASMIEKKKSAELYKFVKEICTTLGIQVKEHKDYEWGSGQGFLAKGKVFQKWLAHIKGSWRSGMSGKDIAERLNKLDSYDEMFTNAKLMNKNLDRAIEELEKVEPNSTVDMAHALYWAKRIKAKGDEFISKGNIGE